MSRRTLYIILVLSLLISITACQGINSDKKTTGKVVKPGEVGVPEITILMAANMSAWMKGDYFADYKKQFEKQYGVKVNYETYGGSTGEASIELMTKLITKDSPALIIDDSDNVTKLIAQGAVLDIKDKVPNISKLYTSLVGKNTYYIPLGIEMEPIILRKEMLEELHIPLPDVSWTLEEYYDIKDKWLKQSDRIFASHELNEIIYRYIRKLKQFDFQNKRASINTPEMKAALEDIRKDIFSGQYHLNKSYTYKSYYNMGFEATSDEFISNQKLRASKEYSDQHFRSYKDEYSVNLLYAQDIVMKSTRFLQVLPDIIGDDNILWSFGIMVNKNGSNLELAYEYINGLLSDEMQLKMFEEQHLDIYPVNEAIESLILDQEKNFDYEEEALQLKGFMLERI